MAIAKLNKETHAAIIKWIFDNHEHHILQDGSPKECDDADSPYVNSLELEKFINSLAEE